MNAQTTEWNATKNQTNFHKHGIWFEEAKTVFTDGRALFQFDPNHSEKEDRYLILGMSSKGRLLVISHCYRKEEAVIRIISARKATAKESNQYLEHFL